MELIKDRLAVCCGAVGHVWVCCGAMELMRVSALHVQRIGSVCFGCAWVEVVHWCKVSHLIDVLFWSVAWWLASGLLHCGLRMGKVTMFISVAACQLDRNISHGNDNTLDMAPCEATAHVTSNWGSAIAAGVV